MVFSPMSRSTPKRPSGPWSHLHFAAPAPLPEELSAWKPGSPGRWLCPARCDAAPHGTFLQGGGCWVGRMLPPFHSMVETCWVSFSSVLLRLSTCCVLGDFGTNELAEKMHRFCCGSAWNPGLESRTPRSFPPGWAIHKRHQSGKAVFLRIGQ